MKKVIISVLLLIFFCSFGIYAQDINDYIELMRADLKTERRAIITQNMQFSEEESAAFWPIYKEYEFEFSKLGDQEVALIKDYADNFEKMTDEKAKDLMNRAFKINEDQIKLRKKYYNKLVKVMSPISAAKFVQLDNQISMLVDLQIASELPLIQKGTMQETMEE
jgi:hypothetical protein